MNGSILGFPHFLHLGKWFDFSQLFMAWNYLINNIKYWYQELFYTLFNNIFKQKLYFQSKIEF